MSIVIPCYNVESRLIHRCLQSINSQSFHNYEVIIVDDGSLTEYKTVFDEIENHYMNVTIYHQENKGVSAARNFGTSKACGKYILYIDADDYLTASALEETIAVFEEYNADIVIGMNITSYTVDCKKIKSEGDGNVECYEGARIKALYKWMLGRVRYQSDKSYLGHGPWNRLVRSELAKKVLFNESLPIGEDIVWNLQILEKANRVCIVNRVWYVYYMNLVSSSRKYRENAIKESYDSLMEIKKYLSSEDDEQFLSFCLRCWSDLKRIYRCYLSYENKNGSIEKNRLFIEEPWSVLSSDRFKKLQGFKFFFMRILYKNKLLFKYYWLKDKLGRLKNYMHP